MRLDNDCKCSMIFTIKWFFRIFVRFWKTKSSVVAYIQVLFIAVCTALTVYLSARINSWYKDFWDAMQAYDKDAILTGIRLFALLAAVFVVTSVCSSYIESLLKLRWRTWLNDYYIGRYLSNNNFYNLKIIDRSVDNPDQRISEDVLSFVSYTIRFVIDGARTLGNLVTFSVILWNLSDATDMALFGKIYHLPDGYLFYAVLVYSLVGTIVTFFIGRSLPQLEFQQQHYEADYRYSLVRFQENVESVALYKGEQEEYNRFRFFFGKIVSNTKRLINKSRNMSLFTSSWDQTQVLFPILISLPMYFAKSIAIGGIQQICSAFGHVYYSMSYIMGSFSSLVSWKATIDRLASFESGMMACRYGYYCKIIHNGTGLVLSDVSVYKPNNDVILESLSLDLVVGDRLIITGHSGIGKTTLLRAIAGIWPYTSGKITLPMQESILFIGQKVYMPLGTLRSSICYPRRVCDDDDATIQGLFNSVGLGHLVGKLDEVDNWSDVLSLGEQQRLAFVRAYLLRPSLLCLDESTSFVDEPNEAMVYGIIEQCLQNSVVVTVGHRSSLIKFHNKMLDVETMELRSI